MRMGTILIVVCFVITVLCIIGWGLNIAKLCQCDFEPPIKAEFIRAVGVFIPPVGAIAGYCEINDDKIEGEPK